MHSQFYRKKTPQWTCSLLSSPLKIPPRSHKAFMDAKCSRKSLSNHRCRLLHLWPMSTSIDSDTQVVIHLKTEGTVLSKKLKNYSPSTRMLWILQIIIQLINKSKNRRKPRAYFLPLTPICLSVGWVVIWLIVKRKHCHHVRKLDLRPRSSQPQTKWIRSMRRHSHLRTEFISV